MGLFGSRKLGTTSTHVPFGERSSPRLSSLASRALTYPESLSHDEIKSLAGSVLTQAPDHNRSGISRLLAAYDETTSPNLASLAARALNWPELITHDEIKSLAGSVLTQAPNRMQRA
jgi:hypothetical protein